MALNSQQLFDIVRNQIAKMQETHQVLSVAKTQGAIDPIDQDFLTKIDDWARRILGVVEGHGMEFEAYHKHRIVKRRAINPAVKGVADVVLGNGDEAFAKAIQSKSTIQVADGAINSYLISALKQLAGTGHEKPRPNDRPTILITIWDPANPWPYTPSELTGHAQRLIPSVDAFKQKVVSVVTQTINGFLQMSAMSSGSQHITGFTKSFPSWPANSQNQDLGLKRSAHQGTERPRSTPDYFYQDEKLKTLLVKFKWPLTYACSPNTFVSGINLIAHQTPGGTFNFQIGKEDIHREVTMRDLLN